MITKNVIIALEVLSKMEIEVNIKRKELLSGGIKTSDSNLENILISLRNAGIVDTVRGPSGGYTLLKEEEEITLYTIIHALLGDINTEDICKKVCPNKKTNTRKLFDLLDSVIDETFDSISLNDIKNGDFKELRALHIKLRISNN